jgi:hypothetical protein
MLKKTVIFCLRRSRTAEIWITNFSKISNYIVIGRNKLIAEIPKILRNCKKPIKNEKLTRPVLRKVYHFNARIEHMRAHLLGLHGNSLLLINGHYHDSFEVLIFQ